MPVFEYRCRACGEEFEAFLLGASDRPRCPGCGGEDLQKKVSVPCCSTAACGPSAGGFS
jgi:putative FmdB family regulatory protein